MSGPAVSCKLMRRTCSFAPLISSSVTLLLQTRPGNWVTWFLIATSLLSVFGGTFGSIGFAFLWVITRGANSSTAAQPVGNYGLPEQAADLNGDLSDDEDMASPDEIQGESFEAAQHLI